MLLLNLPRGFKPSSTLERRNLRALNLGIQQAGSKSHCHHLLCLRKPHKEVCHRYFHMAKVPNFPRKSGFDVGSAGSHNNTIITGAHLGQH